MMHTKVGVGIWNWEPWYRLEPAERILWLGLYTTPEAKRVVPGLFHGSIRQISDSARMPIEQTIRSLDVLLDYDMVEFDQHNRVLRLTELPDGEESPSSGNVIKGWWRRFQSAPKCQVRDAHIATLWWMMERWSMDSAKPISHHHKEAWKETFGTVPIPATRRRGVRRLIDSDTSTAVQPSLFGAAQHAATRTLTSGSVESTPLPPQPSDGVDGGGTVPRMGSDQRSLADSLSPSEIEEFKRLGTVLERLRSGSGSGLGSGSGSGSGGPLPIDCMPVRPHLALVPAHVPFTPEQLVQALGTGAGALTPQTIPQNAHAALETLVAELREVDTGLEEIARVGEYATKQRLLPLDPTTPPVNRWALWAATPGALLRAIAEAREHDRVAKAKQDELHRHMVAMGMVTP